MKNNKGRDLIVYGSIGIASLFLCIAFWIKKMTTKNIKMAVIPDEIIKEEILICLPVKTLIRFKCVSKDWKDFISDDYFRSRLQSRRGNTPTGFFCSTKRNLHGYCAANEFLCTSGNDVEKEEVESFFNSLNTFVIAASKSLLLLGNHPRRLYVYDVVSKKHVHLPRHTLPTSSSTDVSLGFKCEERRSNNHRGRLCYTVVFVDTTRISLGLDSRYNVETYSSETGTWRKSIIEFRAPDRMRYPSVSKVMGGVFYWQLNELGLVVSYDDDGRVLLIHNPLLLVYTRNRTIIRQFEGRNDGSLQFVSIKDDVRVINVWILTPSERTRCIGRGLVLVRNWSLVSSVSLSDIIIGFDYFHTRRIIGADPIDPHIIYLEIENQLYAYDYRQGKIVFTLYQKIKSETDEFVHFEWPTWPCL